MLNDVMLLEENERREVTYAMRDIFCVHFVIRLKIDLKRFSYGVE